MKKYRTVFISDIHLGSQSADPTYLLEFMKTFECEKLYLVGDIIDGWALHKKYYWPQDHNDVIQKLLRKARKNTEIIYIPGNHDEIMKPYCDMQLGNIRIALSDIHITADGKKFLVVHGDQFDVVIRNAKWLAHIGSYAYDALIKVNSFVSWTRKMMGRPYWSLSKWIKHKVKTAVNFVGEFENTLTNYASQQGVDGIVCGHVHTPNVCKVNGMYYYNCGDWVESHTAIVENLDGTMELVVWKKKK